MIARFTKHDPKVAATTLFTAKALLCIAALRAIQARDALVEQLAAGPVLAALRIDDK